MWAKVVSNDIARIQNIPFLSNVVAYEDLVRVDTLGHVLEVVKRINRTARATYDAKSDRRKAQRDLDAIGAHLRSNKIECESARAGFIAMAVPIEVTDEGLLDILDKCPIRLALHE
jgi:hypothetical protein